MTGAQLAQMRKELIADEGLRLEPYRCSEGYLTVLVGYNVDARGWEPLEAIIGRPIDPRRPAFTMAEAYLQVDADIQHFENRVIATHGALYKKLDPVRQRAVVNFAFNLGARALQFKTAINRARLALAQTDEALRQACWDATAFHVMDSLWARQVDDGLGGRRGRADRVCHMIRTGTVR